MSCAFYGHCGLIDLTYFVPMSRHRLTVYYTGRVQGVGFRYAVKSLTPGYEVAGTVRNMQDGRVELVAEGAREELEAFREAIRQSGVGRMIQREEDFWCEAAGTFRGFDIIG
jgi:acylphosphatase